MPEPLSISLIVPAYNEEAYIGPCLDAIMVHARDRVSELIVVDNGSTDGTRAIVQSYPGTTYVFEPRKGITKARQCGFRSARGEVLAFVDADTIPPAGWIEQIEAQFRGDPKLACLSGPYLYHDLPPLRRWIASAWFIAVRPFAPIFGGIVVGGNFAIRRSALEKMGGFDVGIEFYGEDADIAHRARKFGRVRFRPQLRMPTSGRRLEEEGYVRTAGLYLVNFLSIAMGGRPVTHGYSDIR
jgi:glycosyltransferase involved in cell wall biosynthesis